MTSGMPDEFCAASGLRREPSEAAGDMEVENSTASWKPW